MVAVAAASAILLLGLVLGLGLGGSPAMADPGPPPSTPSGPVLLDGALPHPGAVDAATLAHLPQVSLPVVYGTGKGVRSGRYAGVLLWDLLQQAGPKDEAGRHTDLRRTPLVIGHDGYRVAFSFGELDPGAGADLVVPGDRTGARDVHDVAPIPVR